MLKSTAMKSTIQLNATFKHLTVEPAPMDVLEPLLTLGEWTFRRDAGGRLQRQPKKVRLFRRRGDALRTWPGLLHRVRAALITAGYAVDVQDRRTHENAALAHDQSYPAQFDEEHRGFLEAVAAVHRGYVVAPVGEVPRLLASLCLLFPHARILVPCASRAKVDTTHNQLSKWLNEPVSKVISKNWQPGARIAVCNTLSFDAPCFGDWDMLLFPGIKEMLHRTTRNNVLNEDWRRVVRKVIRAARADGLSDERQRELQQRAQLHRKFLYSPPPMAEYRLYGVIPDTHRFVADEQLRVERICGHELYRIHDGRDSQPAQVVFVHTASDVSGRRNTPVVSKSLRAWQYKRQRVWHNEARNKAITSIASAFAAGNLAALWEYGLLLNAPQDWFQQQGGSLRVNILVEVPDHARQLLQWLPGWQLAADVPLNVTSNDTAPKSLELPYHLDKHVVTAAYVERHGLEADVVIRADGLADRWNTRCGRSKARQQGPMLIVDVFDDHDERAVEAARRRIADYRRRGWCVAEQQRLVSCTPLPNRESLLPAGGVAADNLAMQRVVAVGSLR